MKDPLEELEVPLLRPRYWVAPVVALLLVFVVMFPRMAAVIAVILALPIIIMLHELAHFVTAKRSGMKVTEFFVGFGPRLWSVQRGETEYGLKAIPLGGYCKIIGMTNLEEVAPEDEPRAYRSKKYLPKVTVASAGSAMHFALALLLMFVVLWVGGDLQNRVPTNQLETVSGPAAAAGLRVGDEILAIDGAPVESWDDVPDLIRPKIGEPLTIEYSRGGVVDQVDVLPATGLAVLGVSVEDVDGAVRVASVDPQRPAARLSVGDRIVAVDGDAVPDVATLAQLVVAHSDDTIELSVEGANDDFDQKVAVPDLDGVEPELLTYAVAGLTPEIFTPQLSFGGALVEAPQQVWEIGDASVHALIDRFSPSGISQYIDAVTGDENDDEARFVSVIGYGGLASNAVEAGWIEVFGLLIAINVFVGVFNLVPLLPFDGGHVAIATYEKIASTVKRRPVHADVAKLLPITAVVVGVLAVIFFTSVFMDIADPIANPF